MKALRFNLGRSWRRGLSLEWQLRVKRSEEWFANAAKIKGPTWRITKGHRGLGPGTSWSLSFRRMAFYGAKTPREIYQADKVHGLVRWRERRAKIFRAGAQ